MASSACKLRGNPAVYLVKGKHIIDISAQKNVGGLIFLAYAGADEHHVGILVHLTDELCVRHHGRQRRGNELDDAWIMAFNQHYDRRAGARYDNGHFPLSDYA